MERVNSLEQLAEFVRGNGLDSQFRIRADVISDLGSGVTGATHTLAVRVGTGEDIRFRALPARMSAYKPVLKPTRLNWRSRPIESCAVDLRGSMRLSAEAMLYLDVAWVDELGASPKDQFVGWLQHQHNEASRQPTVPYGKGKRLRRACELSLPTRRTGQSLHDHLVSWTRNTGRSENRSLHLLWVGRKTHHAFKDATGGLEGVEGIVDFANANMAGPHAVSSITRALRRAVSDGYDAVVLSRGGGSETDMAIFDSAELATAVQQCAVPVLAAIGHRQDDTLVGRMATWSFDVPKQLRSWFAIAISPNAPSKEEAELDRKNDLQRIREQEQAETERKAQIALDGERKKRLKEQLARARLEAHGRIRSRWIARATITAIAGAISLGWILALITAGSKVTWPPIILFGCALIFAATCWLWPRFQGHREIFPKNGPNYATESYRRATTVRDYNRAKSIQDNEAPIWAGNILRTVTQLRAEKRTKTKSPR